MSMVHIRDDARRRIPSTATRVIKAEQMLLFINAQRVEEPWTYGVLIDAREASTLMSLDDDRSFPDVQVASKLLEHEVGRVRAFSRELGEWDARLAVLQDADDLTFREVTRDAFSKRLPRTTTDGFYFRSNTYTAPVPPSARGASA